MGCILARQIFRKTLQSLDKKDLLICGLLFFLQKQYIKENQTSHPARKDVLSEQDIKQIRSCYQVNLRKEHLNLT